MASMIVRLKGAAYFADGMSNLLSDYANQDPSPDDALIQEVFDTAKPHFRMIGTLMGFTNEESA